MSKAVAARQFEVQARRPCISLRASLHMWDMKISEEYPAYNVKDAMFGGCGTIAREGCVFIIFGVFIGSRSALGHLHYYYNVQKEV
jgi:hypothetical protein